MNEQLSNCCHAPVIIAGLGSTHWHECTECGQGCDVIYCDEDPESTKDD